MMKQPEPVTLFLSYAHEDELLRKELEKHLSLLQRQGFLSTWHDRQIVAGTNWVEVIDEQLEQASIILLLVSSDFLASDYCYQVEMQRALSRHRGGQARVIPIIVRPCDWRQTPFAKLQCLPENGKPLTTWDNQDEAFDHITQAIRQMIVGRTSSGSPRAHVASTAQQNQDRTRMLRRLRRSYGDLLAQSLQGTVWIDLGLAQMPDAVRNVTTLLFRSSNQPEQSLPTGTSILQVYEEAEHEVLILGEPGAGKSTLLLHLAQQLVTRAEQDDASPLPVILPLSSWAVKRPPLQDWISEQLTQIYDIPARLAQRWVREEQILLLLDGLDEMEIDARPACIAAINGYHREHLIPLVVCSRKREYDLAAQHQRLALQSAVVVQPLSIQQVKTYLDLLGQPLVALRQALKKNPALQELAMTPLMFNVLLLTYRGTSIHRLPTVSDQLQRQVWTDYLQRMVARKGDVECYPLAQTRSWLGWLARQMREHNQTVFYLEHLQPDWLAEGRSRCWYERLATKGAGIIIGVLLSLLITTLFFGVTPLPYEIWYGSVGGLVGGLISGSGASGFQLKEIRHLFFQRWRSLSVLAVGNGVLVGGLVAIGFALWEDPPRTDWLAAPAT